MAENKLTAQLEELQLLQCSLLPNESLVFLEDSAAWIRLLGDYTNGINPEAKDIAPPHFQLKVEKSNVWFEVTNTGGTQRDNGTDLMVSVKGEDITRVEQEHWQEIIQDKLGEIGDSEFPIYQLMSLHLLPLLHEEVEHVSKSQQATEANGHTADSSSKEPYHALLTSHHLISPNKRRSLQQWSSSLSVTGFAKVGYPGVIYAQGARENVEEFVANIKAMQWLALRVRFLEPLEQGTAFENHGERQWNEFKKVGEVVEEMRRIGREEYVVEMGIGSAGTK
ncbi:hypothetical protein BDQ12DRAFT_677878 [Crucibulum laeve]|uniref:Small nuclear ribonucleoprotein Prp3 C-terminal domain-containing protein n=1 Tax=Crucibulum laeve TaxID=68775 RepID=A0A5C3MA03_9AGAR|nr:hypothetical protein BDQ12DRAFT_677878 [Crucibulum laeve]